MISTLITKRERNKTSKNYIFTLMKSSLQQICGGNDRKLKLDKLDYRGDDH